MFVWMFVQETKARLIALILYFWMKGFPQQRLDLLHWFKVCFVYNLNWSAHWPALYAPPPQPSPLSGVYLEVSHHDQPHGVGAARHQGAGVEQAVVAVLDHLGVAQQAHHDH